MIVRPVVVIEESLNKLWSQQHVSCEEYNALPDVTESKYVFSITCCGALITFACHITHNVWIHIAFYSHNTPSNRHQCMVWKHSHYTLTLTGLGLSECSHDSTQTRSAHNPTDHTHWQQTWIKKKLKCYRNEERSLPLIWITQSQHRHYVKLLKKHHHFKWGGHHIS